MFFLKKIPILIDNYIWILVNYEGFCIIVDPGCSQKVIKKIKKNKWKPIAILLTHNHQDHIGGVKKIIECYPKINVFGLNETKENYVNKIVRKGEKISILDRIFYIFFTPGHTLDHICYYSAPYLFCGDTIFSGGCGRVYKNKYLEMYHSIKFLSYLPNETILCCGHEYTLSNLKFAMSVLPYDQTIRFYFKKMKYRLSMGQSTLPSYFIFEKKINIFLRTKETCLKQSLGLCEKSDGLEVFIKLRIKKDFFGAKRD